MNILNLPLLLAQTDPYAVPELTDAEAAGLALGILGMLGALLIPVLIASAVLIIANWKLFSKAGQPGWAAVVPVYSNIVLLEVQKRPVWWIVFWLIAPIPILGTISVLAMYVIMCCDLSKQFGKGGGFTAGLILLFPIFLMILAFGSAQYQGASAAAAPPADPPAAPPADPPADPPAEEA